MPSDNRMTEVLELLKPRRDQFRSAVATAADELRATLSEYRDTNDDSSDRAAVELGRFARGRIDPTLFAFVFGSQVSLDPAALEWLDRSEAVLRDVVQTTHLLSYARVEPGGSLRLTVERALARIGRAFGAVRVAEWTRLGRSIQMEASYLELFPYSLWNRAERRIALPLIVEVNGSDLHVGGLEEFLDGSQLIVLLVNGEAPPAALVRLVTPNVLVMQTASVGELVPLATTETPAIAALVPEACAQFTAFGSVVTLINDPAEASIKRATFRQREELLQLRALARTGAPAPALAGGPATLTAPAPTPAPEDVLGAWLLRQAGI